MSDTAPDQRRAAAALVKILNEVIAFGKDLGWHIPSEERQRFQELSERAYDLAHGAGLAPHLPQVSELVHQADFPHLRPAHYEGALKLPGDWLSGVFFAVPSTGWLEQLQRLRRQAETLARPLLKLGSADPPQEEELTGELPDVHLLEKDTPSTLTEYRAWLLKVIDAWNEYMRRGSWNVPKLWRESLHQCAGRAGLHADSVGLHFLLNKRPGHIPDQPEETLGFLQLCLRVTEQAIAQVPAAQVRASVRLEGQAVVAAQSAPQRTSAEPQTLPNPEGQPLALPPAEPAAPVSSPRVIRRSASVNARMLETIQTNLDAIGWSCKQWAEHLKCARSSVVETPTWKDLAMRRERKRAERARDRRRRPKASDRRPD